MRGFVNEFCEVGLRDLLIIPGPSKVLKEDKFLQLASSSLLLFLKTKQQSVKIQQILVKSCF